MQEEKNDDESAWQIRRAKWKPHPCTVLNVSEAYIKSRKKIIVWMLTLFIDQLYSRDTLHLGKKKNVLYFPTK